MVQGHGRGPVQGHGPDRDSPPSPGHLSPGLRHTTSTRELASPEWVKESVKGTTGVGTWMDDSTLKGLAGATQIGAAVATAYVAYLPAAAAVGAIAGKNAERRWQACLQELSRAIGEVDPATALQRKLEKELNKIYGATTVALPPGGDPFQTAARAGCQKFPPG